MVPLKSSCNPSRMWQEGKWCCQVCISGGWLLIGRPGGWGRERGSGLQWEGAALHSGRGSWIEVVVLGEGTEGLGWAWMRLTGGWDLNALALRYGQKSEQMYIVLDFVYFFLKTAFLGALIIGCKFYSEPPLLSQRYICTGGWPASYLFLCFLLEYSWFTVLCELQVSGKLIQFCEYMLLFCLQIVSDSLQLHGL